MPGLGGRRRWGPCHRRLERAGTPASLLSSPVARAGRDPRPGPWLVHRALARTAVRLRNRPGDIFLTNGPGAGRFPAPDIALACTMRCPKPTLLRTRRLKNWTVPAR